MTVILTPDIEQRLDQIKKNTYYNRSYSEMMRSLIVAGPNSLNDDSDKTGQQKEEQNVVV